ncbi:MAG: antibiotic biosynthesis monooxygenase [Salibacteraceae bacterium]
MVRIVKMKFKTENIEAFRSIFFKSKPRIEEMSGCNHVELIQDIHDPTIMMTYSIWDNEGSLNLYRNTEFFRQTWQKTKALFDAKPEAWSLETINSDE